MITAIICKIIFLIIVIILTAIHIYTKNKSVKKIVRKITCYLVFFYLLGNIISEYCLFYSRGGGFENIGRLVLLSLLYSVFCIINLLVAYVDEK